MDLMPDAYVALICSTMSMRHIKNFLQQKSQEDFDGYWRLQRQRIICQEYVVSGSDLLLM